MFSCTGSSTDQSERRPIFPSVPETVVSRAWAFFIVSSLVALWCVLDSWNHDMSSQLFQLSEVQGMSVEGPSGHAETVLKAREPFSYTLTLVFVQFAFVGLVFLALFAIKCGVAGNGMADTLGKNARSTSSWQCQWLVVTHVFSSVLLQGLMMPTQMMSLGFFAATRAVEVPTAAVARSGLFKVPFGGHAPQTVLATAAAAWILFYSYTQISECLCVWSGFGIALTGLPLYSVYALLLTIPATNVVLQESFLVQLKACPLFMQAMSNLIAALVFVPVLVGAHCLGYEDVLHAAAMITHHREVYMTVLWLCLQTTAISGVTVCLLMMVDSFWVVSARGLRVVFWWVRQLPAFYMSSNTLLSVSHPSASMWSLGMVVGIGLALTAILTDLPSGSRGGDGKAKGLGSGQYV